MKTGARDCIFCGIIGGTLSSNRIAENDTTVAFLDIFPTTRGHALVVPKRHVERFDQLEGTLVADLMQAAQRLAPQIQKALGAEGYNIIINTGTAAGQVVHHVHVHVIPRYADDGHRAWPGMKVEQHELAVTAEELKKSIRI